MSKAWRGILWVLALAASSATGAPPRCQAVSAAVARLRLEVWGRELAGVKGMIATHSARRVAWVADRHGTALEALFLATLDNWIKWAAKASRHRGIEWSSLTCWL